MSSTPQPRRQNRQDRSIDLHIEELALHGFQSLDSHVLDAAVRTELTRLLAVHGLPAHLHRDGERAALPGGNFTVVPGADAATLGVQIAHAIYGGLDR